MARSARAANRYCSKHVLACLSSLFVQRVQPRAPVPHDPTGLVDYSDLRSEYAEIQRQDAALDAENLSLSREIRLLQTDQKYVEKMIRQRLHYLRDNEILYLFDAAPKSGASSHD